MKSETVISGNNFGIVAIHHFAIIVSSEASVDFYTKLGFKEMYRRNRKYDTVVLLDGYGIQIEMFVDPNHPKRAVSPENIGLRHVALKVEKIEETIEELRANGLGFESSAIMNDWIGERFCFITDPDGLQIELHEQGLISAIKQ